MAKHENSLILEGTIVNEPQIKDVIGGNRVTTITVASDQYYRKEGEEGWQKKTDYIIVELWNKVAEAAVALGKGAEIKIKGSLASDKWEKDGETHYRQYAKAYQIAPLERQREQVQER